MSEKNEISLEITDDEIVEQTLMEAWLEWDAGFGYVTEHPGAFKDPIASEFEGGEHNDRRENSISERCSE